MRGLLALNAAAASAGAMVIVNTVVLVQGSLQRSETDVAIAFAAFGGGSMAAALMLPRLLEHVGDRSVMRVGAIGSAVLLAVAGVAFQAGAGGWASLLLLWLAMGVAYSTVLTPSGRLLRRSAHQQDRPAVFAAQFALSHACWLATYPLAGWLGAEATMPVALFVLAALAACGAAAASLIWPADDPDVLWHEHDGLSPQHPHVQGAARTAKGWRHAHAYVIDEHHARWPAPG